MGVVDEIDDLFVALKRHAEDLPIDGRQQYFRDLEYFGARPTITARTFERLTEELADFIAELEDES